MGRNALFSLDESDVKSSGEEMEKYEAGDDSAGVVANVRAGDARSLVLVDEEERINSHGDVVGVGDAKI